MRRNYQLVLMNLCILLLTNCISHSSKINANDYTKENKKIPTNYGIQPTILVFLLETNLKNPVWVSRVERDSKQQINEIFPHYYKGEYKIVNSYGEFDRYEDISLHRYVLHYKVIFPTKNSRDGQYSPNYGDDKYQIFIEDMILHFIMPLL